MPGKCKLCCDTHLCSMPGHRALHAYMHTPLSHMRAGVLPLLARMPGRLSHAAGAGLLPRGTRTQTACSPEQASRNNASPVSRRATACGWRWRARMPSTFTLTTRGRARSGSMLGLRGRLA